MSTFNGYRISPEFLKEMNKPTLNSALSPAPLISQEDQLLFWEPSDDQTETINSLEIFRTLHSEEEGRKLTTREVRASLKNFDSWLVDSIETLIKEEKEKDIESFN